MLELERERIHRVDASGGTFELTADGGMVFVADSLYHALVLKLLSLSEGKKLRRCRRPDCDCLPYFIANQAKQQYCSEECGAWGQQQLKKAWWEEHGKQWRAKRGRATEDSLQQRKSVKGKRKAKPRVRKPK